MYVRDILNAKKLSAHITDLRKRNAQNAEAMILLRYQQ